MENVFDKSAWDSVSNTCSPHCMYIDVYVYVFMCATALLFDAVAHILFAFLLS